MHIKLFTAPMSSAVPVVHALEELGVEFEKVTVNLQAGEQRSPALLALNPNGKVPTMSLDGTPMFETLAIILALGDQFGVERELWPAPSAPARLEALSWCAWAYVTFGAALQRLIVASSEQSPKQLHHAPIAKEAHAQIQDLLGILDQRLTGRAYLLGDRFTLADLVVGSVVTYGTYCGVDVKNHEHVRGFLDRFQTRPAYQRTWAENA